MTRLKILAKRGAALLLAAALAFTSVDLNFIYATEIELSEGGNDNSNTEGEGAPSDNSGNFESVPNAENTQNTDNSSNLDNNPDTNTSQDNNDTSNTDNTTELSPGKDTITKECNHSEVVYEFLGDGRHVAICTNPDCDYYLEESCDSANNGSCTKCGSKSELLAKVAPHSGEQTILINGQPFISPQTIEYGDTVTFSVQNSEGESVVYIYVKQSDYSDDCDWLEFKNAESITLGGIGSYYIGAHSEDPNGSIQIIGNEYPLTIEKAHIGDFTNIQWNESNNNIHLSFTPPTTTKGGKSLNSGDINPNYILQLYKEINGTKQKVGEPISTAASDYEFSGILKGDDYGFGSYYCSVMAQSSNTDYYINSEECFSPLYKYEDKIAPTITSFTYSYDPDGKIASFSGTARDDEDGMGIYAYAFSTQTDVANVSWTDIPADQIKKKNEIVNFTQELTEGGTYYFYVKDGNGNVAKSESSIKVTKITYFNTYKSGTLQDPVAEYYEGESDITISNPLRKGYEFTGFYIGSAEGERLYDPAASSYTITSSDSHFATSLDLYANWSNDNILVTFEAKDISDDTAKYSKEYNKAPIRLTASVTGIEAEYGSVDLEYQWYVKHNGGDYEAIEGANQKIYDVVNVNQTGEYKVELTIKVTGELPVVKSSESSLITINKKAVTVSANEIVVQYGSDLPDAFSYSDFTYEGIVDGDTESITLGSIVSIAKEETIGEESITVKAYERLDPVGRYYIVPKDFSSDNYELNYEPRKNLIVNPKNVNSEASGLSMSISPESFIYDAGNKEPAVTIVDTVILGDETAKTLDSGDYDVAYSENVNASDNALVTVTFKGNYTGTLKRNFSIVRDSYTISSTITGWKYGDYSNSVNKPVVVPSQGTSGHTTITIPEEKLHYYFRSVLSEGSYSDWTEMTLADASQMNAGDYQLYVRVDEMDNYSETSSIDNPASFTIAKRNLIFKSEGGLWLFDGNAHGNHTVTMPESAVIDGKIVTQDGFAGNDTYLTLSAAETITDAGEKQNTIAYSFTKSTNENNYNIICDEGTLKVTPQKLVSPTEEEWDQPGIASWVPVSRSGLEVGYNILLFKDDGTPILNGESKDGSFYTSDTSYDFSEIIRSDSASKGLGGYYFKVEAIPSGGKNENNYVKSEYSGNSPYTYTSKIIMEYSESEVRNATIDGKSEKIVIAGETNNLMAHYNDGYIYYYSNDNWIVASDEDADISGISITNNTYEHFYKIIRARINLKSDISKSATYTVKVNANDETPVSTWFFDVDYSSRYKEDMTKVVIRHRMSDSLALAGYTYIKVNNGATEDDIAKAKSAAVSNESQWEEIAGTNATEEYSINEEGIYYFAVKDSDGQIAWSDPCIVYSITFEAGENGSGTMPAIYKVAGYDIEKLPANAFTRAGYGFTEWGEKVSGKVYSNQGMYTDDKSQVLVAKWSNEVYSYTVNYYLMGVDGQYTDTPSEIVTFQAVIGATVSPNDPAVRKEQTGFTYDESKGTEAITITGNGQSLNIYYSRNQYTISYSYTDIDGHVVELPANAETYYYAADLIADNEASKPVRDGYTFVGWVYDGSGSRPNTMPAASINAVGSFKAKDENFKIHYYVENLKGDGYVELTQEIETRTEEHDKNITFSIAIDDDNEYAKDLAGYTISKVAAAMGDDTPDIEKAGNEVEAKVSSNLHVYYYYTRNTYKLYLNVFKGTRDNDNNKFYDAYWEYKYESDLTDLAEDIATYYENVVKGGTTTDNPPAHAEDKSATVDLEGYVIAEYHDWSTGNKPAKMPAGDVTVSRDYIQDITQEYKLNVYFQDGNGNYVKKASLNYYAPAGYDVRLMVDTGDTEHPAKDTKKEDDFFNPYTSQLSSLVDGFNYYYINENPSEVSRGGLPESVLSGTVTKSTTGTEAPLELHAYFDRKEFKATIYYFYNDASDQPENAFATEEIRGIWGSNTAKLITKDDSTIFGFNPLKYFDELRPEGTVDGNDNGQNDSYRAENCLVSYTASWNISGGHWQGYEFLTEASISSDLTTDNAYYKTNPVYFGHDDKTVIYVHYMPVNKDETFGIEVWTHPYGNTNSERVKYTYPQDSPKEYVFKIVNKSEIYNATPTPIGGIHQSYPALDQLTSNYTYDYSAGLKAGYTELTDLSSGVYHYYLKDNDTDTIYIVKDTDSNREAFYVGKRYNIHLNAHQDTSGNSTGIPRQIIDKYVEDNNSNEHNTQIYVHNSSTFGLKNLDDETVVGDGTLTYTFLPKNTYRIYHRALGNECAGHEIVQGRAVSLEEIKAYEDECNYVKECNESRPGYELHFYPNSNFTGEITPIASMSGNVTYFGNYTRKVFDYNKYFYYELANHIVNGDSEISYITESMIAPAEGGKATVTKGDTTLELDVTTGEGKSYTINDNAGNTQTVTPVQTIYSYNGQRVLMKEEHKCYAFQVITLPYSEYVIDGFEFDGAQSANALNAYLEATPITLRAYYSRNIVYLSIKANNNKLDPDEIISYPYRYGQSVTVHDPVKLGYSFDGWIYKRQSADNPDEYELLTDFAPNTANDGKGVSFVMPMYNLLMEANWVVADIEIPVYEYFQTNDKQYLESTLKNALSETTTKSEISISVGPDNSTITGTAYYSGDSLICVSITDGDYESFYTAKDGDTIKTTIADLFAMVKSVSVKSENTISFESYKIDKKDKNNNSYFALSSALCQSSNEIISQADKESFEAEYGMEMNYYYTRVGFLKLRAAAKASDNERVSANIALSGSVNSAAVGDTLTAPQSPSLGFEFRGWYKASEVLSNYSETAELTSLPLVENWAANSPVSTDPSYSFRIFENTDLIAIYDPAGFPDGIKAELETERYYYTYGYAADLCKNIHASVSMPANTPQSVYVKGYKWILCDSDGTPIDLDENRDPRILGTGSDYKFPIKHNAGDYYYKCIVEISRKDTGRSKYVDSNLQKIHVEPVKFEIVTESYAGIYDGANHSITVTMDTENYEYLKDLVEGVDYEIYYSETLLESQSYTTAKIEKKDVKVNPEGDVVSYDVYYYVKPIGDNANNYNTVNGNSTITINPKTLSVSRAATFIKAFDNKAEVTGTIDASGASTDKYRLAYGDGDEKYYDITGFVNEDEKAENILNFDAVFNSKHVNDAGSVSLTNLSIVSKADGTTLNNNYAFPVGAKLIIGGYISQAEINVTWDAQEGDPYTKKEVVEGITKLTYAYNGKVHTPNPTTTDTIPASTSLLVEGGQTNIGEFVATASLVAKATADDIDVRDYKINNNICRFEILSWTINVKALDANLTYDRDNHTINSFKVRANTADTIVVSGGKFTINSETYTITMKAVSNESGSTNPFITSYRDAGTYRMIPDNIQIINQDNKNVTDNFVITAEEGSLTINKKEIVVNGIKAYDKIYDGNNEATPDFSGTISYKDTEGSEGVKVGDSLKLDESLITAAFSDKDVGDNKTVTINIPRDALLDTVTMTVSKNYVLKSDAEDGHQVSTTEASITKEGVTMLPKAITMNYGDAVPFAGELSGAIEDPLENVYVWGTIKFTVTSTIPDETGKYYTQEYTYSYPKKETLEGNITLKTIAESLPTLSFSDMKLNTGMYKISLDATGLESEDYSFSNGTEADLVVNKKAITSIVGIATTGKEIKKIYDGTTKISADLYKDIMDNQSSYFTFEGLMGDDTLSLVDFKASYNDKNVNTDSFEGAKYVVLTDFSINSDNYEIDSTLTKIEIPAKILPRPLTMKASDITATYGDAKGSIESKYKASFAAPSGDSGLVDGETESDVYESFTINTSYDDNVAENRNAGDYALEIYTIVQKNGNYEITKEPGTLHINKKLVKVSAIPNASLSGDEAPQMDNEKTFRMVYGDIINGDWFKPSYDGFVYSENAESLLITDSFITYEIQQDPKYGSSITISNGGKFHSPAIAGVYTIYPQVGEDVETIATNYTFETVNDKSLKVNKKRITLNNNIISIVKREYDATKGVYVNQLRLGTNADVVLSNSGSTYPEGASGFDFAYLNEVSKSTTEILDSDMAELKELHDTGIKFDLANTYYAHENVDYSNADESLEGDDATATGIPVTLKYDLSDFLSLKYELNPDSIQPSATSHIYRKPLLIKGKVEPESIVYGNSTASFSNVYNAFAGEETIASANLITLADDAFPSYVPDDAKSGDRIAGDNKEVWITDFNHSSETDYSQVKTYTLYPIGFKEGASNNYFVSYEKTEFSVIPAQLEAPIVTWDSNNAGCVSFSEVPGIGNVAVDHYEMHLYKKGEGDAKTEVSITSAGIGDDHKANAGTAYDLLEIIRSNGVGTYIVEAKAVASLTNNAGNINVIDSNYGVSAKKHAINVTLRMNDDAVTNEAVVRAKAAEYADDKITLKLKSDDNYITLTADSVDTISGVFIEGEKNIKVAYSATGAIATGYEIGSILAAGKDKAAISFRSSEGNENHDYSAKTRDYDNDFTIGELSGADDIVISLPLKKELVTIAAALEFKERISESTGLTDTITYGYQKSPVMQVNVSVQTGDSITTDDYEYEYKWLVKKKGSSSTITINNDHGVTAEGAVTTFSFPQKGQYSNAYPSIGGTGDYYVYCEITATRKDNGATAVYKTKEQLLENGQFTIKVESSPLKIETSISKSSWMYGDERGVASYSGRPDDYDKEPVYYYSVSNDISGTWGKNIAPAGWSQVMLTDANNNTDTKYYMVAFFESSANYEQLVTTPIEYTISKNTFGDVKRQKLCLSDDGEDSYGLLRFTASESDDYTVGVAPIYENNGSKVDGSTCHSVANPSYNVTVEYSENGADYSIIKEYKDITDLYVNISEILTKKGSYRVSVNAVPNSTIERDVRNVNPAPNPCVATYVIGNIITDGVTSKVYDGIPVSLTADFAGEVSKFEWYCDNGANVIKIDSTDSMISEGGKKLSPKFVNQSGDYYCVATINGQKYTSIRQKVTITKRPITLSTGSADKIYDGTALTKSEYTFTNIPDTDSASVVVTGTITNSGTVENAVDISSIKITHNGGTDNVFANNYSLGDTDIKLGTLTINKRNLSLTAQSDSKVYDGMPLTKNAIIPVTEADGLLLGDNVTAAISGIITNVGSVDNTIDTVEIKHGEGETAVDVTDNYSITRNKGTLTVSQRKIKIITDSDTKIYDGSALTKESYSLSSDSGYYDIALGERLYLTYTGTQTNKGTVDNTVNTNSTRLTKDAADPSADTTNNYAIEYEYGTLTVYPRVLTTDDLNLSADVFEYNGSELGPVISVNVDLNNDGSRETLLNAAADYTMTEDAAANKIAKAILAGQYIVEITGKGNYTGTVFKSYKIINNQKADIKDGDGNTLNDSGSYKYCKEFKFTATSPNLARVIVTKLVDGVETEIVNTDSFTDGSYSYTINGEGDDVNTPTEYRVTVKDYKDKAATEAGSTFNTQSLGVYVYPDHYFRNEDYILDESVAPQGEVYKAPCSHECGKLDYILKPQGEVTWKYHFAYKIPGSEDQEGTQHVSERETYAVVELMRNGSVIATKLINCTDSCGVGGAGYDEATISYSFDSFNALDSTKDSGPDRIELNDPSGKPYEYALSVSPVKLKDDLTYVKINSYKVSSDTIKISGDKAEIRYEPDVFMLPWRVRLIGIPDEYLPESVNVKLLYADKEDAPGDAYAVISQHESNNGVTCALKGKDENGYAIYEGVYPVWKFIGGGITESDTYYHRIQLAGYTLNGEGYTDVMDRNYKSICDMDHVNHTVTYDVKKDSASGIILYDLAGLLPTLVFERNIDKEVDVFTTIWKGLGGGIVTADEIKAVGAPTRNGYDFAGWFDSREGGKKIEGEVDITGKTVTVYAHWNKKVEPTPTPDEPGGGSTGGGSTPYVPTNPVIIPIPGFLPWLPVSPMPPIKDEAPDDTIINPELEGIMESAKEQRETIEDGINKGSIIVYVKTNDTPAGKLTADAPNKPQVVAAIMNEEIGEAIDKGECVEIRITVDPKLEQIVPLNEKELINKRVEDLKKTDEGIRFGSFIDLKLDYRISGGPWNNVPQSSEPILVTIAIPAELLGEGRKYYISHAFGDYEELLTDLDSDSMTITIATSEFRGTYSILYSEMIKSRICIYHYLILLCGLVTLLLLLLIKVKKDEELEDEEIEALSEQDLEDIDEKNKKYRRRNSIIRCLLFLIGTVLSVIFAILGFCKYDWPCLILQLVATGAVQVYKEVNAGYYEELSSSQDKTQQS